MPVPRVLLLGVFLIAILPLPCRSEQAKPIPVEDTVFVEEMTWVEVRDSLTAGKTTVIIPTGGVEMNGPFVVTGKHNYIVRACAGAIARKLDNALVAPVVPFVPEGDIDPPTDHMRYPGTISLTESTYERLLTEICGCFRTHGFRDIVLIGDSGGNQDGMKTVATALNAKWKAEKTRVHFIPEYYDYESVDCLIAKAGIVQKDEGLHDDFAISAQLATINPTWIRARQRQAAGKYTINGVELAPTEKTAAWGQRIIDFRAEATVKAIREKVGVRDRSRGP